MYSIKEARRRTAPLFRASIQFVFQYLEHSGEKEGVGEKEGAGEKGAGEVLGKKKMLGIAPLGIKQHRPD